MLHLDFHFLLVLGLLSEDWLGSLLFLFWLWAVCCLRVFIIRLRQLSFILSADGRDSQLLASLLTSHTSLIVLYLLFVKIEICISSESSEHVLSPRILIESEIAVKSYKQCLFVLSHTEALEGHFSYYLQLICYSLIVITYLLRLTWFHIDMLNSDCYVPDFM